MFLSISLRNKRWVVCWLSIALFVSCSPRALHEAQDVVSQADSLWQQGEMYRDSVSLAQAYSTLGNWKWFYADEYAHSCYHYGKLLRAQDDPVSAMQVFINATHAGSDDKQILGRIYNNMGDICHRANEFDLSYDMFKRSAEVFLSDKDTLSYYYCLNDMAFELAEQGKKEETLILVARIEENCADKDVIAKMWETKARLYLKCEQYDSVIYAVNNLLSLIPLYSSVYVLKAQALWYGGNQDSALYYAKYIMHMQDVSEQDKYNMLYIIINGDSTLCSEEIVDISAQRSDIETDILIPLHNQWTLAVHLLEQDLHRKPNLVWLYVMIATIIVAGSGFYWRIEVRKRQMERRVTQFIEHQADSITQSIKQHIDSNDIAHTLHWKNYAAMKADTDLYMGGIVSKLEKCHLNETEIRFCILTMLDFSLSRIAETLYYSYPSGIKTLKKRISVKLGITPSELRDSLFQKAANA